MTGVAFTLITLRVGLGKAFSTWMQGGTTSSHGAPAAIHGARSQIPMHVRITHEQDVLADGKGVGFGRASGYGGSDDMSDVPSMLPAMSKE